MEMRRQAIDIDLAPLKASRRTTRDPEDDIDRAVKEYRITKVKCLAALVVQADHIENTADIGHETASPVQNAEVRETIITTTNIQNLRHSSTRENNGWKCSESKQKFPIWEQCNRLQ
jgi:hypothetical protein